jgi:putative transposase
VSAYIDQHRDRFGVEPICSVLRFAPRTYYAIKARPPSTRALRDAELKPLIARVHRDNFGVYGVDKSGRSSTAKASGSPAALSLG